MGGLQCSVLLESDMRRILLGCLVKELSWLQRS